LRPFRRFMQLSQVVFSLFPQQAFDFIETPHFGERARMMMNQSKTSIQRMTQSFAFFAVLTALPSIVRADHAMGFRYDDVAECSSSIVQMNDLAFDCDSEEGCTFGDQVTVTGDCK
jgi:hypothetical protein